MHRGVILLLVVGALALVAGSAAAKDEPCTFGADCLCDRLEGNASVVFCEDFEDPVLNNGDDVVPGTPDLADGWADKYGAGVSGCIDQSQPAGEGLRDEGMEGTNEWSCINIVQEGACEVGDDCVFQGTSSLAHRMRPNENGGIVGDADWSGGNRRDFGYTMAIKYSENYISPKQSGAGPAHKTNEFDDRASCILGCSVSNAGNPDHPFAATLKPFGSNPGVTVVQGRGEWDGASGFRYGPTAADYDFASDWGKGRWACLQMKWTGWGSSNGEARYWLNGRQIVHLKDINMTSLQGADDGIDGFFFNSYYNGEGNTGYPGSSIAHRLEDNIVVTAGDPVTCRDVGFDFDGAGTDGGSGDGGTSDGGGSDGGTSDGGTSDGGGSDGGTSDGGGSDGTSDTSGAFSLHVESQVVGDSVTVTSTVSDAVGSFQYLFDCRDNGSWDGVVDTDSTSASHTCRFASGATGTRDVRAWVWDRGLGETVETVVTVDLASGLEPPGRPVLVDAP